MEAVAQAELDLHHAAEQLRKRANWHAHLVGRSDLFGLVRPRWVSTPLPTVLHPRWWSTTYSPCSATTSGCAWKLAKRLAVRYPRRW